MCIARSFERRFQVLGRVVQGLLRGVPSVYVVRLTLDEIGNFQRTLQRFRLLSASHVGFAHPRLNVKRGRNVRFLVVRESSDRPPESVRISYSVRVVTTVGFFIHSSPFAGKRGYSAVDFTDSSVSKMNRNIVIVESRIVERMIRLNADDGFDVTVHTGGWGS